MSAEKGNGHDKDGLSVGDGSLIRALSDHIERHIGPVEQVLHEVVSEFVHIDVHIVAPSGERNCYTLVTSGMSERPMQVDIPELRHAELMLSLPPDWPILDQEKRKDERYWWPLRLLYQLARYPHADNTWLGWGHTIGNDEPYGPGTELSAALLVSPPTTPDEFDVLELPDGRLINIYAVIPLYDEELDVKLDYGAEALVHYLANSAVSEIIEADRPTSIQPPIPNPGEMDADARYQHLLETVEQTGCLWGLTFADSEDQFMMWEVEGQRFFVVWPHLVFAADHADGDEEETEPVPLLVADFVESVIPQLEEDGVGVLIFPTADGTAYPVLTGELDSLKADLLKAWPQ